MSASGVFARTFAIVLALMLPAAAGAGAAPDLAGVWQGRIAVDADTSLTVQFTFTRGSGGAWTAVLNSPGNPALSNVAVSDMSWDGTSLSLQVPSLSGAYAGTLKNGSIDGQWTQPGAALPLALAPYQRQVLSRAAIDSISGPWHGVREVAGDTAVLVFDFKADAAGELQGTFSIPDQGLINLHMSGIELANGELSLRVPQRQASYSGRLSGNQITGRLRIPHPAVAPEGVPVNLTRGAYTPQVHTLRLAPEAYAALRGRWEGKMEVTVAQGPGAGQKVALTMLLRFETNEKAEYVAYLDVPEQQAQNIAVTDVTLANGRLSVKVATLQGEFSGTLSGNTATGEWTQVGQVIPLTLTRTL